MAEYKSNYTGEEIDSALGKANTALQQETDPIFSASPSASITNQDIANWNGKSDFSGSYDDLTDKPTIPDQLSDLTEDSTHRVVTDTEKATWNNKSDFSGSYNDLSNKPELFSGDYEDLSNKPDIPSATSDLTNDSGFITNSVNNLVNYYLKNEVYTKDEVTALIGAIQQFHYEVVQELPQTGANNIMYLVPKSTSQTNNVYDEYVYSNGWEKIGDTEIDLSNYVTITALNTALADYTTTANLTTLLNAKQDVIDSTHKLDASLVDDSLSTNKFVTSAEKTTWNGKQDTIQYATMPTADSTTVGKIVQYTGTTDANYTNGYFYIGTTDGGDPATYSWENINVQDSGSNDGYKIHFVPNTSAQNPLILEDNELGIYYFGKLDNSRSCQIYMKINDTYNTYFYRYWNSAEIYFVYTRKPSTVSANDEIGYFVYTHYYFNGPNASIGRVVIRKGTRDTDGGTVSSNEYAKVSLLENNETVPAKKTFTVLPESSVVPTTNNQLVNKKYVDDQVGAINTVLASLTTPSGNGGE